MISETAITSAKKHARQVFPAESCGVVIKGEYLPCENKALPADQHEADNENCRCVLCSFSIADEVYLRHAHEIEAVIHSHPHGPEFPSRADMAAQIASGLTWGIIALDEERIGNPVFWGGREPIKPLIGREFRHGITDCYDLIRDTYALGRRELGKQGITGWPYEPIELPRYARDDAWWEKPEFDFYNIEPFKIGFREINMDEAKPGDIFLVKIRSDKFNHGGVLIGNDLILHHLPSRLSRREPSGLWARQAERWLRWKGDTA